MRNSRKSSILLLMLIAVIAVGTFALPSSVSLFTGQHTWYNISNKELPCIKCHADIYDEYMMTGAHGTLSGGSYNDPGDNPNGACYACHRVVYSWRENTTGGNITYASGAGTGSTPGKEAHAATTVACMACHEFGNVYGGPAAGGFEDPYARLGIANDPVSGMNFTYNDSTHPGGHAAHQGFIEGSINNTKMEDANEACIACHTAIPVKITWTHAYNLEFNATYNASLSLPPTHFDTSNYTANGSIVVTSYGNGTGGASTTGFP
jgi:hypothetical protein